MQNIGETVSRKVIMKDVFGFDNYAADRTIDTHIKNIRKKI
jgi:DNA-binding response OmpR family regulator